MPRVVEPGFKQRWARETLELFRLAPDIWLLLVTLFAMMGYVAYPILGTGQCLLGAWQMFVAVELVQVASERPVTMHDVAVAARLALPRTIRLVQQAPNPVMFAVIFSGVASVFHIIAFVLSGDTLASQFFSFNPSGLYDWIFSRTSPLICSVYGVMWGVSMAGTFYFTLMVMFGIEDGKLLRVLARASMAMNSQAGTFALIVAWCGLFVGYIFPLAAPLAAIAFPVFSFVVTRDMFLHGDGNKRKRATPQRSRPLIRQPS